MKNIKIIIGYRNLSSRFSLQRKLDISYHLARVASPGMMTFVQSPPPCKKLCPSSNYKQKILNYFYFRKNISDLHYLLLSNIHNYPISFLICNSFLFLFCHFRTANNQLRDRFFHSGLTRHDELLINGNKRKQDMIIKSNMFQNQV